MKRMDGVQALVPVWVVFCALIFVKYGGGPLLFTPHWCGLYEGPLAWWWACHKASDCWTWVSTCYFSPPYPLSPRLLTPQKWCQDNRGRGVCMASHQLWKFIAIPLSRFLHHTHSLALFEPTLSFFSPLSRNDRHIDLSVYDISNCVWWSSTIAGSMDCVNEWTILWWE